MRVMEDFIVKTDADHWLSLEALSKRSGMSVRMLRAYLTDLERPLPHYRMREPHVIQTKAGKPKTVTGKILVRWSDFSRWMDQHFKHTPDVDRIVDEVVTEFRR